MLLRTSAAPSCSGERMKNAANSQVILGGYAAQWRSAEPISPHWCAMADGGWTTTHIFYAFMAIHNYLSG